MTIVDSLKEQIKELYHGGIDIARKHVAPIALVGVLGFVTACNQLSPQSTSAPIPAPEIRCDKYRSSIYCKKGDQTVLLFEFEPKSQMRIGDTAKIKLFISQKVAYGGKVIIKYINPSFEGWPMGDEAAEENRKIFASIPVNQEITIPFKPDSPNCFRFYIEGVYEDKVINPSISHYGIGKPTRLSLQVDKRETTTYNSITIRGQIDPSLNGVYGYVYISGEGKRGEQFDFRNSPFEFMWVPSQGPGTYKMYLDGDSDGRSCEYISSRTDPIEIVVK